MKINLKYLKLHNFLSFEDAELDLHTNGYTLVQGVNNNPTDLAASNGSGKSTLFEAIVWCLTGETIRGSKEVKRLTSEEKDTCWVSLEFDIDNNKYGLWRQASPSKLSFNVNGKDISGKGIRDTEKTLKEYLPYLTSSLIGSVIILGQGLPQRFSNNTPAGRKEVLETLSNSDVMIYDLKNRISNRDTELASQLRQLEDELIKNETQLSVYEEEIPELKTKLNALEEPQNIEQSISECILKIKQLQDENNELSVKLETVDTEYYAILKQKDTIYSEMQQKQAEILQPFDIKLEELQSNKISSETTLKLKKSEYSRLSSIKDICPTCGQKLIGVEKPDTTALVEEIKNIENALDELNAKISEVHYDKDLVKKETDERYKNQLSDIKIKLDTTSTHLNELEQRQKQIINDLHKLDTQKIGLETAKSSFESTKQDLENRIKIKQDSINSINTQILYINNKVEELQKHIAIVQKMKTVITRDFRGYLLSSVIDFINRKAKEYSQEVFDTDKIEFCLDGNNISISYDGKEYENLSGGERQKIDLIIQFSIRDMLCRYLNFSSNILAVDELFDALDSVGCDRIINLISKKLSDVESIYIITHRNDLSIPLDNILTVVKEENGISHVMHKA